MEQTNNPTLTPPWWFNPSFRVFELGSLASNKHELTLAALTIFTSGPKKGLPLERISAYQKITRKDRQGRIYEVRNIQFPGKLEVDRPRRTGRTFEFSRDALCTAYALDRSAIAYEPTCDDSYPEELGEGVVTMRGFFARLENWLCIACPNTEPAIDNFHVEITDPIRRHLTNFILHGVVRPVNTGRLL